MSLRAFFRINVFVCLFFLCAHVLQCKFPLLVGLINHSVWEPVWPSLLQIRTCLIISSVISSWSVRKCQFGLAGQITVTRSDGTKCFRGPQRRRDLTGRCLNRATGVLEKFRICWKIENVCYGHHAVLWRWKTAWHCWKLLSSLCIFFFNSLLLVKNIYSSINEYKLFHSSVSRENLQLYSAETCLFA